MKSKEKIKERVIKFKGDYIQFMVDMYLNEDLDAFHDITTEIMSRPEEFKQKLSEFISADSEKKKTLSADFYGYIFEANNYDDDKVVNFVISELLNDCYFDFMESVYADYDHNLLNVTSIDVLWGFSYWSWLIREITDESDCIYYFNDRIFYEVTDALVRFGEIDDNWNSISKEEKSIVPEPDGYEYGYYFTHGGLYDIADEIEKVVEDKNFEDFLNYYTAMNTKDVYVDPYEFETTTVKEGQQWIIDSDWYKGGRIYSADYLRENNVPEEFIKANYMKWMPDTIFVTKEADDDAEESYEIPVLNRKNFMKITHCESENG